MNAKTTMKTALLAAALAVTAATAARADANPANDSGSFTVRITPNVDLGVVVDTSGANWVGTSATLEDLTSDLGTQTQLQAPIGVTMAGNFGNQELTLTGVALNTWQLDTDELDAVDELRLYAMFGNTTTPTTPTPGEMSGVVNLVKTSATRAGQTVADEGTDNNHVYELATAHLEYAQMDDMLSTAAMKLWLMARTPNTTTTDAQAGFTVTLTAVTGVGN